MQKRPYRQWPPGNTERMIVLIVLSLFVHLFFFGALDRFYPETIEKRSTTPLKVSMRTMSKKQWQQNLTPKQQHARKQKQEKPKVKKKEPEKPSDPLGQVVELSPPKDETKPEESRFLSEYDSSVKKETRSKYQKSTYERHAPKPKLVGVKEQKQAEKRRKQVKKSKSLVLMESPAKKDTPAKKQQKQQKTAMKLEIPKRQPQSKLKLKDGGDRDMFLNQEHKQAMKGNSNRLNVNIQDPTEAGKPASSKAQAKLTPADAIIIGVAGGPMADHLENIDESDETALNTRAFKYATYFNRVKREVARNWSPARVHRKYDPNFNIYGYQDRRTVLWVTVRKDGGLERVEVQDPSGVDFLDEEAIAAFYRGSPFPPPPEGLLKGKDTFGFSFGFYFEISSVKFRPLFGPP